MGRRVKGALISSQSNSSAMPAKKRFKNEIEEGASGYWFRHSMPSGPHSYSFGI
jgi:hypothetical protein